MFSINDFQIPSMPGAVPGASSGGPAISAPVTPAPPMPLGGGSGFGAPPAPSGPPPVSSPMGGIAMPAPAPMDPSMMQYDTETQADGTVLLRVKSPDGNRGPVIQIISPKIPKAPSSAPR